MSNQPSNQISFVDRAIATITEAAGPHRDEWSPYDHDVVNQARDADAKIERLRAALERIADEEHGADAQEIAKAALTHETILK